MIILPQQRVKPDSSEAEWQSYTCDCKSWNQLEGIPGDWEDVLVYVTNIDWNNGLGRITELGPPGSGHSIIFGANNCPTIYPTSTKPETANRYFGYRGVGFAVRVPDPYIDDNREGGLIIKAKNNPNGG